MDDDLLAYYNAELIYLRELGSEFARKFPRVAARLLLESDKCEDPHVERLLEGVAFLTARVRKKIDDEYPEITEALLSLLAPHLLRPIPSLSIAQFTPGLDPTQLREGYPIPAGTGLATRPVDGFPCLFRTAYPVSLYPLDVHAARLLPDRLDIPGRPASAAALLQLELRSPDGASIADLRLDRLRFHLDGEPSLAHALHSIILRHTCAVWIRGKGPDGQPQVVPLPEGSLREVGFGPEEGLLPDCSQTFPGYRLLQEYFAFPEKFLFFDVSGLQALRGRPWGRSFEILIFLRESPRSDLSVDRANFRLGATPIVNLFPHTSEPIRLERTRTEYRVVPDLQRPLATEIYSISSVLGVDSYLAEPVEYQPFYSLRGEADRQGPAWYATRRPSGRKGDPGTEVYLTFVDPSFRPNLPSSQAITVRTLCTNRDLPARLPFGGDQGDLLLEAPGPVGRVRCLRRPTAPLRPPLGRDLHWRLISHLSLNHLSLVDAANGAEALRAVLSLLDWVNSPVTRQLIRGVSHVSSRRIAGRTGRNIGNPVALGLEVTVDFDEAEYVGTSAYLMASVLERFLALYGSINTFTQLVARVRPRDVVLHRWPPRSGERTLL